MGSLGGMPMNIAYSLLPWGTIPFNGRASLPLAGSCPLAGQPQVAGFSDDTNAAGSRVIAQAFARALPSP